MAFSDHLTTNCMMASYAHGWRRLTPLFSVRAFRHIQRPVELNPWVERTGRGGFPNSVRKLGQAAAYARSPKEPAATGEFLTVDTIVGKRKSTVHLGSARTLTFLQDKSIDVVMTDPPYFDNIAYSELAQFFVPWLKALGVIADKPRTDVTRESLVARKNSKESVLNYTSGLGQAFREMSRVLRPKGIVAFSYRHTEAPAWHALAQAIAMTELYVTKVVPMPGEVGMGLHGLGERGLWDAVFILRRGRPQTRDELFITLDDLAAAQRAIDGWSDRYGKLAIPFNSIDAVALRRAFLVGQALGNARKCKEKSCVSLEVALR
jgi:adenine-specific DNA methylase